VSTHQSNYSKILALRATSRDLDTQIRDTLSLLTKTRSELLATPSTNYPSSTNPVSYSELLSYARRISKFTLPPNYREAESQMEQGDWTGTPKESKSETQTNGTTTPVTATNGVDSQTHLGTAMEIDGVTPAAAATQTQTNTQTSEATTVKTNTAMWSRYLNPADAPFMPWPSEETIRRGALASIQILVDQGIDPATFDPEKSAELEAERKRVEEEQEALREQERARLEEERRREMERRMSVSGVPERREEPQKVFQLETFDDDEDDD
jgi:Vitamin-D-receptor interacting Mediator subunit 4